MPMLPGDARIDLQPSRDPSRELSRGNAAAREALPPEMSPTTPPLPYKPRTSSRRTSRSVRPGETPALPQPAPDAQPPAVFGDRLAQEAKISAESAPQELTSRERESASRDRGPAASSGEARHPPMPMQMAEEVMARLARRAPEGNLHVRTSNSRQVQLQPLKPQMNEITQIAIHKG